MLFLSPKLSIDNVLGGGKKHSFTSRKIENRKMFILNKELEVFRLEHEIYYLIIKS